MEMLKLARRYAAKFKFDVNLMRADMSALPYADSCFDYAIAVASLHHINTAKDRFKALAEIKRVLKPGGEAFITVWNRCQPRFWFKRREVMVPWRARDQTFYRYYYLFTYPELEALVRQAGLALVRSYPESRYRLPVKYFSRNICLLVKKMDGLVDSHA
jgi:ubiquinone/menaquinone biosynthesis C-methylase UbiE